MPSEDRSIIDSIVIVCLSDLTRNKTIIDELDKLLRIEIFQNTLNIELKSFLRNFDLNYSEFYGLKLTFKKLLKNFIYFFLPFFIITFIFYWELDFSNFFFYIPEIIIASIFFFILIIYFYFDLNYLKFFIQHFFNENENVSVDLVENSLNQCIDTFKDNTFIFENFLFCIKNGLDTFTRLNLENNLKSYYEGGLLSILFSKFREIYLVIMGTAIRLFLLYLRNPTISKHPLPIMIMLILLIPFIYQVLNYPIKLLIYKKKYFKIDKKAQKIYNKIFR